MKASACEIIRVFVRKLGGWAVVWCAISAASYTQTLTAQEVTLAWDPNQESDLAGYRLYFGNKTGEYSDLIDVGNRTNVTFNATNNWESYYSVVTAYNTSGLESLPSNEVVYSPNGFPTASDDSYGDIPEDSGDNWLGVLLNDNDPDGDPLTIVDVGIPDQGGTAVTDGTQIKYSPAPNFYGAETFSYTISDGRGGTAKATASVTVINVNDAPAAADDMYTDIPQGSSNHSLAVLDNDSDIDGDPLTITHVGTPDQGGTAMADGTFIIYSPAPGFSGTEYFSYSIDDGQGATAEAKVSVVIDPPAPAMLIERNSSWRYLDTGRDLGTTWRAPTFDDSSWQTGTAQLGFGEGDEATVISYGSDWKNKHITTYFRHTFSVNDPTAYESLTIRLLRDPGAVVYLNGVEVVRSNMPEGTINASTYAAKPSNNDGNEYLQFTAIAAELLAEGLNVLATEVHLARSNYKTCGFDIELEGISQSNPLQSVSVILSQDNSLASGESGISYGIERLEDQSYFTVTVDPVASMLPDQQEWVVEFSQDLTSWSPLEAASQESNGTEIRHYIFPKPLPSEPTGFIRLRQRDKTLDFR